MKTKTKAIESGWEERQSPNSTPRRKGAKAQRKIISALASLRLCAFALMLLPLGLPAATNDLTSALQKGLFEEEANHNLDAAAQAYQAVSAQFDKDRKLAATAIFRLGEVYRKQGKTNEATGQYERIVREFSDQQTLVTLSRQNLAGMGAKAEAPVPPALTQAARLEQKRLLDEEIKLVEQDLAELKKQFAAGVISQTEVRAKEREVLKLQQQVAALDVDAEDVAAGASAIPVTDDEEKEIRRIQEMIKNSPDLINAPSGDPIATPLCRAARLGQLRVARFLLDAGAVVDLQARGSAPTHLAAANGHKAMVELLLERGADANVGDSSGRTPLHLAAENGFQSVVETLLAHKADVTAESKNQETPLSLAAAKGHAAMVDLLVAKGAQVDARLANGWTALMWAAFQGHADVVKRLLAAKADPNAQDSGGGVGSRRGRREPAGDDQQRTVLSYAVERGHLDVVRLLLDAKADPNAGLKDLPLVMAVRNKQLQIAELLLRTGARPNLASKISQDVPPPPGQGGGSSFGFGRGGPFGPYTPLQMAVAQGDAPMAKLLFKFKADANAKDAWNDPPRPLMGHALGNAEFLQAFLDAGADANADHSEGWPMLAQACAQSRADAVKLLLAHGAKPDVQSHEGEPLIIAANRNCLNCVQHLLEAKADANATTPSGVTALHWAVSYGSQEMVEALIAHGAAVNRKIQGGATPLHWAVTIGGRGIGAQKMAELLLSKGADPNVRNNDGLTPLDLATGKTGPRQPGALPPSLITPGAIGVLRPGIPTQAQPQPVDIAAMLREHGALDDLPDFSSIRVTRVSVTQPMLVFVKDANSINRFTLLEVVRNFYQDPNQNRGMPFPDFSKIIIHRPVAGKPGAQKEITVNLLTVTNSFDCSKDTWLEFGDVVEIPEREHTLSEQPVGMAANQRQVLSQCLEGKVTFVVRGQKAELKLDGGSTGWLQLALSGVQNLLRSSSDLSHIKIKRTDPATGKASEIITDSKAPQQNNVWLRDGDVIEVPDKP